MRLGTACGIRGLSVARRFAVIAIIGAVPAIPSGNFAITMRMARHLLFCAGQRRRSLDGNLLPQNCPDRHFKGVKAPGHPDAGRT